MFMTSLVLCAIYLMMPQAKPKAAIPAAGSVACHTHPKACANAGATPTEPAVPLFSMSSFAGISSIQKSPPSAIPPEIRSSIAELPAGIGAKTGGIAAPDTLYGPIDDAMDGGVMSAPDAIVGTMDNSPLQSGFLATAPATDSAETAGAPDKNGNTPAVGTAAGNIAVQPTGNALLDVVRASPFITPACVQQAADRYAVPLPVMLGIMKTEGGHVGGASPNTNGSYDLGPMQVNDQTWVPVLAREELGAVTPDREAFIEAMLRYNACYNIDMGFYIYSQYLAEADGNLMEAVGWYNSHDPVSMRHYQSNFTRNFLDLFGDRMAP